MEANIEHPTTKVAVLSGNRQTLHKGDRVEWQPGPRAKKNAAGVITKYDHPFLTVDCDDGMQRKVRPGATNKVG